MSKLLFPLALALSSMATAQRVVIHQDLIQQSTANTAFKVALHGQYRDKLAQVEENRKGILTHVTTVEEVHRRVFNTLTNVDGALRNGRTLWYIGQKVPQIFTNLKTAAVLAKDKPYLVHLLAGHSQLIIGRVGRLQQYLQELVLQNDPQVLINPIQREKMVHEVYTDISIIHSVSNSMVSMFRLYNLQDAVEKIVPLKMYYNMDRTLVQDIMRKTKF
jgi:hypothetical protein